MFQPRKQTKSKGQPLPADFLTMVGQVVEENFERNLKGWAVLADGSVFPTEVDLRISLKSENGPRQLNFEASVDKATDEKDVVSLLNIALDAIGSMLQEYFDSGERLAFPESWQPFQMDKKTVFLQVTNINHLLENKANDILKKSHH